MKYEEKRSVKNIDKTNNKSTVNNNIHINGKILLVLKQNWDKIEIEFNSLMKKSDEFTKILLDSQTKKEFKLLISLFSNFKDNVRNVFFNVGINIGNLSSNNNNNNNNNVDNNNSNKIQASYDNIYNEFLSLESIIKDINNIQINSKKKKKKQIENLENKLHEYMDELDKLDFDKIDKLYNNFNDENKKEIENIILQNDFIEQYNYKEFDFQNENNKEEKYLDKFKGLNQINNQLNINTLNHDSDSMKISNKNQIINGIVNMKENNKEDAIKYIQSLINKQNTNDI